MMNSRLYRKEIGLFVNSLPKTQKVPARAQTYNYVSGVAKKGKFEIYSYFDNSGKLIKQASEYNKDGINTKFIQHFHYKDNRVVQESVKAINNKVSECKKSTLYSDGICAVEELGVDKGCDLHRLQYLQKGKPKRELSYKTFWNGKKPKIKYKNVAGVLPTEGREYLPLFISQGSIERANHIAKVQMKNQDLVNVAPEMQMISRKQLFKLSDMAEDYEKAKGLYIDGLTNVCTGQVYLLNTVKDNTGMLAAISHEYQHVKDRSDFYRLEGAIWDASNDFTHKSYAKGEIKKGTKRYNEVRDMIIDANNYEEKCKSGKHDELKAEVSAINKEEKECALFRKIVSSAIKLLKS